jgi:hypothetical protein
MAERTLRGIGRAAPIERIPPLELLARAQAELGELEAASAAGAELEGIGESLGTPTFVAEPAWRPVSWRITGVTTRRRAALSRTISMRPARATSGATSDTAFAPPANSRPRGERHSARCGVSPRIDRRSSRARRHRGRTRLPVSPRRLRLSSTSPKIQTDSLGRGGCRRASGTSSLVLRIAVAQEPSPLRVLRRPTLSALGYTGVFR